MAMMAMTTSNSMSVKLLSRSGLRPVVTAAGFAADGSTGVRSRLGFTEETRGCMIVFCGLITELISRFDTI